MYERDFFFLSVIVLLNVEQARNLMQLTLPERGSSVEVAWILRGFCVGFAWVLRGT